jgi:hypothetical protein
MLCRLMHKVDLPSFSSTARGMVHGRGSEFRQAWLLVVCRVSPSIFLAMVRMAGL